MNASGFWRPAEDTFNADQLVPWAPGRTPLNGGGASMRAEAPLRDLNSPRNNKPSFVVSLILTDYLLNIRPLTAAVEAARIPGSFPLH